MRKVARMRRVQDGIIVGRKEADAKVVFTGTYGLASAGRQGWSNWRTGQFCVREFCRTPGPFSAKLVESYRASQRARMPCGGLWQRNWRKRLWNQPTLIQQLAEDRQVIPATDGKHGDTLSQSCPRVFFAPPSRF